MNSFDPQGRRDTKLLPCAAPKRVRALGLLATLVGIFFFLRFCASAYVGKLTWGKAILYGFLVLALLFMNGFSLVGKSRFGYAVVVIAALVPMPALLAQSFHLLTVVLTGGWQRDDFDAMVCTLSIGQLVATGVLFFFLLSRDVRAHVWKSGSGVSS
jgi:hypothetical protein